MTFLKQNLLCFLLLLTVNTYATTHYVKYNATGANNGTSWTNAYTDLQNAINAAVVGDLIWVAAGTYKPNQEPPGIPFSGNAYKAFYLNKDLKIYGGFAGTETLLSQRNYVTNVTILSGDIGSPIYTGDNCIHILINANLTTNTIIDGFTIKDSEYSGTNSYTYSGLTFFDSHGGGIYNNFSSPTLVNLSFVDNFADIGAGIYNEFSSPTLTNISFTNNAAIYAGGGIYNHHSNPILTNIIFSDNTANEGGGIYNSSSSPIITNASFIRNSGSSGGGISNDYNSFSTLTNISFIGNTLTGNASGGGAVYNQGSLTLTNISFTGNSATKGSAIYNNSSFNSLFSIRNTIIWDNGGNSDVYNTSSTYSPTFYNSIIEGAGGSSAWNSSYGIDGGNNLDIDPLFYAEDDIRIGIGSPALDVGNNAYNSTTTDLNGNIRIQNGTIDIGAVEGATLLPTPQRYYVKHNAIGTNNNGTSWANAFTDFQVALNTATKWDTIWVAAGIYKPTQYPTGVVSTDSRNKTFYFNKNLKIYGGFVGTETQLSQRNFTTNITTLSGDIGIINNSSDNCYHVLIGIGLSSSAIIDGFTVKDGKANNSTDFYYKDVIFRSDCGGGMYYIYSSLILKNINFINNYSGLRGGGIFNDGSSSVNLVSCVFNNNTGSDGGGMANTYSSPILSNVSFINNSADGNGGGMYNSYSSPILSDVIFTGNIANNTNTYSTTFGGGMFNTESSPLLINVSFTNNSATSNSVSGSFGGGIYNSYSSSPTLINVSFTNNSAVKGGGMRNIYTSSPTLINVSFIGNSATEYGGGMYNSTSSSPILTNTTFSNNSANILGSAICTNDNSFPVIRNSIIWGNNNTSTIYDNNSNTTFNHSLVDGSGGSASWNSSYGIDGGNNIDINPLFVSSTNVSLQIGSPAIGAGNNAYNTTATDLAGNPRINNNIIDLGAYEFYNCVSISVSVSDTIYQDAVYTVGNSNYNATGNYADTLQTWQGCDSIINLNLLVLPVIYITDTIVLGESYPNYYCFNTLPTASLDTLMNIVISAVSNNCLMLYGDNLGTDSTYFYTNSEKVYFYLTVENGVWPGDTDDDAFVNNSDLLNIGLAYGSSGISRDSQTIQWNGYLATDWGATFVNSVDYKHADADGNGVVNAADTLAIIQNWGLSYNKNGGNTGSPIYLAMDALSIQNNTVSIPVILGTIQEPVTDLYGIVFSLSYDDKIVEANSMNIILDNNAWVGSLSNLLSIQKDFSDDEIFEYGITRINQNAVTGYGQIGHLRFTLNQNVFQGNDSLFTFEIFDVIANDNVGITIPIQGAIDHINLDTITQIISSTQNIKQPTNFRLYPNPTTSHLNIEVLTERILEVSIFNVNGKHIKDIQCQTSSTTIDLNDMPNGFYLIRVTADRNVYTYKVLKL